MKKDIEFPSVKDVLLAVIPDPKELESPWQVYLMNTGNALLTNVMVSSTGFGKQKGEEQKTSTLRYSFDKIAPDNYQAIELIDTSVFHLNNEYWVTFFSGAKLMEKKFIFGAYTIDDALLENTPVVNKPGVVIW